MADRKPILDLDTLLDERPTVRIDGTLYPIRAVDELSILGTRTAWARFAVLSDLLSASSPSKAAEKRLSELLDELCRMVLAAPSAVHDKLNDQKRLKIVSLFSQLLPGMPAAGATATMKAFVATKTKARRTGAR